MSATHAAHILRRAEALQDRLKDPEPQVDELLAKLERTVDELEARFPNGDPGEDGAALRRLGFLGLRMELDSTLWDLEDLGVDLETAILASRLKLHVVPSTES